MILLALAAALLLGAALGARGMHRLGRGLRGPWRPGASVGAALALFAALALLARAEWLAGGLLLALAAALAGAARWGRAPPRPASPGLTRREAARLLGVSETATAAEVEAAHRRLIRRLHPDVGGTEGLAAQLNAARAALLASEPLRRAGGGPP